VCNTEYLPGQFPGECKMLCLCLLGIRIMALLAQGVTVSMPGARVKPLLF